MNRPPAAALDQIAEGVAAAMGELFGSHPTAVKAYWLDDLVVCLMHGAFSLAEQAMADEGYGDAVLRQRQATQGLARGRMEAVVAAATGRKVVGFMSGNQLDGVVCEMFLLDGGDDPYEPGLNLRLG